MTFEYSKEGRCERHRDQHERNYGGHRRVIVEGPQVAHLGPHVPREWLEVAKRDAEGPAEWSKDTPPKFSAPVSSFCFHTGS